MNNAPLFFSTFLKLLFWGDTVFWVFYFKPFYATAVQQGVITQDAFGLTEHSHLMVTAALGLIVILNDFFRSLDFPKGT